MDTKNYKNIENKLEKCLLSGATLLNSFRVLHEHTRVSSAYTDHKYSPFYYYLGEEIKPESVVDIGFGIGIASGCLLKSCESVKEILGFQKQDKEYYSPRLGIKNIKDNFKGKINVYVGQFLDDTFIDLLTNHKWDLIIVNEETNYDTYFNYLEKSWENLALDGTLIIEYVKFNAQANKAYDYFCKSKGREPYVFHTRYGTGIITK